MGAYGARNLGDEAILWGLLQELPPLRKVVVLSHDPNNTNRTFNVSSIGPSEALSGLWRCNVLLIGGGGLFAGNMRLGQLIPFFGLLAKALGKRVIIHGVGMDPSTPLIVRTGLKLLVRWGCDVAVRDDFSADLLEQWSGRRPRVFADFSHFMPKVKLPDEFRKKSNRPLVGLSLTAVDGELKEEILEHVPALIRRYQTKADFFFVPTSRHHSLSEWDDLNLARSLQEKIPSMKIIEGVEDPRRLRAIYGTADAMICMRYHSFQLAHQAGTPILGVPYAQKCHNFLKDHGLKAVPLNAPSLEQRLDLALGLT